MDKRKKKKDYLDGLKKNGKIKEAKQDIKRKTMFIDQQKK